MKGFVNIIGNNLSWTQQSEFGVYKTLEIQAMSDKLDKIKELVSKYKVIYRVWKKES